MFLSVIMKKSGYEAIITIIIILNTPPRGARETYIPVLSNTPTIGALGGIGKTLATYCYYNLLLRRESDHEIDIP